MTQKHCRQYLFLALLTGMLPAVSGGIIPSPAYDPAQLVRPPQSGWPTNGGNLYNQRYSPLASINRDTVAGLKARWRTHLNGSGMEPNHSAQAQALVHEGTLYIVTGMDDVFAVDVESGAILWNYEARVEPADVMVCCGWVSRGVGMGDGKIYVGRLDARLVALDQASGEVLWDIRAEDPHLGYSITAAPLYYDGMVITGFAGGEMGIRGRIKAFDAKDGSLIWTFYTIPGPDDHGGGTWPADNDAWKHGGAPIWQTPAIDPELGMIYFSTGNAAPDVNGAVRAGDNLFTASILALDVATGEYRWHFQQVHHDIWDYDSANPVVLFDAPYHGVMRKGIAEINKTGWVYILDRATGEPLIGIEERPVPQEPRQHTAATQPYPIGDAVMHQYVDIAPEGAKIVNGGRIFTPFWDELVAYRPMMAANWPPSSYDPETQLFYICSIDNIGSSKVGGDEFEPPKLDGSLFLGSDFGWLSVSTRGILSAMDLTTNRLVWQQQWKDTCMSGSVVTAGGLLFVGRNDGRLTALDKRNGDKLWEFQTDAGVNTTVSIFEHGGTQYVAVLAGGSAYAYNTHGDSLWMFALDGTIDSLPSKPSTTGTAQAKPDVLVIEGRADIANGQRLFRETCLPCHGNDGTGGQAGSGPTLETAARDYKGVIGRVWQGGELMPPFRDSLTPEEIRDISRYLSDQLFPERER